MDGTDTPAAPRPWRRVALAALALATLAGSVMAATPAATVRQLPAVDEAFRTFWGAEDPEAANEAAAEILAAGAGFEETLERLRRGPGFTADVPTGRLSRVRVDQDGVEHPWLVLVPEGYDPSRSWPVRVFLHGGVSRPRRDLEDGAGGEAAGTAWWRAPQRVAGPGHISVFPHSWEDSLWWEHRQVENLRGILRELKRTYHVDDDRVSLFGVSDGGSGAWFHAFRAPTPWAAFVALISHPAVLASPDVGVDTEMFVENLRNRPLLAINGGRDRLYPAAGMRPYLELFREASVPVEFVARPGAGHDIRWWPDEAERIGAFLARSPRERHPERLWWETENADRYGRVDWLVVEALGRVAGESSFAGHNTVEVEVPPTLGVRLGFDDDDGVRLVEVVDGTPASRAGLQAGDTIRRVDGRPVSGNEAFQRMMQGRGYGGGFDVEVERAGERRSLRVELPEGPETRRGMAFPHSGRSGRVEVHATGNSLEIRTRGVRRLALLLSPDAFDLSRPVRVMANREVVFDRRVEPRVETLLRWAARDADHSRLYAAELVVDLAGGPARQR